MPLPVILLPIFVSGKTIDYFLVDLLSIDLLFLLLTLFHTRFQISYIFSTCIYPITWLIIMKWQSSGQINIFIIKKSHKILKKGRSLGGDRASICDLGRSLEIMENYTFKKLMVWIQPGQASWVGWHPPSHPRRLIRLVWIGTDIIKMVCTRY